jgi:DNA phosphorothioation-dependent restriction protein DptG
MGLKNKFRRAVEFSPDCIMIGQTSAEPKVRSKSGRHPDQMFAALLAVNRATVDTATLHRGKFCAAEVQCFFAILFLSESKAASVAANPIGGLFIERPACKDR